MNELHSDQGKGHKGKSTWERQSGPSVSIVPAIQIAPAGGGSTWPLRTPPPRPRTFHLGLGLPQSESVMESGTESLAVSRPTVQPTSPHVGN